MLTEQHPGLPTEVQPALMEGSPQDFAGRMALLESQVQALKQQNVNLLQAMRNWADTLNRDGVLHIYQALIDATAIGGSVPAAGSFTDVTISGDETFTGTAKRIKGDFSNATRASRTLFIDKTTDNGSNVGVIPNGTSNASAWTAFGGSNPDATHFIQIVTTSSTVGVNSGMVGGTTRALGLQIDAVTKTTLNTDSVLSNLGLVATKLTAGQSMTLAADYGAYVPSHYEIPAAYTVEVAASAVFEIGG